MPNTFRTYSYRLGSSWTPVVQALIIVNGAIFLIQELFQLPLAESLGLIPYKVLHQAAFWQLLTYLFLHGGFLHILFNMFALWMFGSQLERVWGSRKFLTYYFVTGIGAGFINVAVNANSFIPTIGASGAVYGLLLAYGVLFPNNLIMLYFIIPMKAKYFVILFAGLEFLLARSYTGDGVAHFAHLGGMAVGFIYLKGGALLQVFTGRWRRTHQEHKEAKQVKLEVRRMNDLQAVRSEVDYLLGRISRVGYENLSPEERERLEEASRLLRLYSTEPEDLC